MKNGFSIRCTRPLVDSKCVLINTLIHTPNTHMRAAPPHGLWRMKFKTHWLTRRSSLFTHRPIRLCLRLHHQVAITAPLAHVYEVLWPTSQTVWPPLGETVKLLSEVEGWLPGWVQEEPADWRFPLVLKLTATDVQVQPTTLKSFLHFWHLIWSRWIILIWSDGKNYVYSI